VAWVSYKSVNYNYYSSKAQVRGSCNFGARVIGLDAVFNPLVNSLPASLSYMGSVRPLKPQVKAFPIFFLGGVRSSYLRTIGYGPTLSMPLVILLIKTLRKPVR